MMKKLFLIATVFLIVSCSKSECELTGMWKSIEFTANKPVDINGDNKYNANLIKEDKNFQVTYTFKEDGIVERLSRNSSNKGQPVKSIHKYSVDNNTITFDISGMKQTCKFKIENCKLSLYDIKEFGKTEDGKNEILISSTFDKVF